MPKLYAILLVAAVTILPGCPRGGTWPGEPGPVKMGTPAKPVEAKVTPASTQPVRREVLALIDGKPIYMDRLYKILLNAYGMPIARQLISTELVLQEARRRNITITRDDVLRENDLALKEAFGTVPAADQRERLLKQFLDRFQVSPERWDMTMRRNAYLAKMAGQKVQVSDQELADEFGRRYGRGVVVRHIQTASLEAAQRVRREAALPGADFAKLAYKHSINASGKRGGLLPAITEQTTDVAPGLKRTALTMKTPGELSEPIMAGTTFHILRLEKVIPPKGIRLVDVKDKLLASIRERKVLLLKQQILSNVFRDAKIEFVNPILKAREQEDSQP